MEIFLVEGGDVFAPRRLGARSVLLAGSTILKVGAVDAAAVHTLATTAVGNGAIVQPSKQEQQVQSGAE